jgi:hypothetical protein
MYMYMYMYIVGHGDTWKCSAIRGVIGVSGPYDLVTASDYLHGRGLHRALVSR